MSILCTPDNLHIIVYALNNQHSETPLLESVPLLFFRGNHQTAKSELVLID